MAQLRSSGRLGQSDPCSALLHKWRLLESGDKGSPEPDGYSWCCWPGRFPFRCFEGRFSAMYNRPHIKDISSSYPWLIQWIPLLTKEMLFIMVFKRERRKAWCILEYSWKVPLEVSALEMAAPSSRYHNRCINGLRNNCLFCSILPANHHTIDRYITTRLKELSVILSSSSPSLKVV